MDEDAGVKAPVTRLRRRLSVEQSEENKSPAVSTPTKRRGRKKPDLDLIDENTPENTTTRRTKKTAIKDVIDPVEDKPVTPSRRSTRIKSNTGIVSETAVAAASPRAKRATRRTSQVGSDNEAPVTPIRTTRRTRKDSASSIDKGDQPTVKPPTQITEAIEEETETTSRKSTNSEIVNEQNKYPDGSRKSPRLMKKLNQSIDKTEDVVTDQSNSSQEAPIPDKIEVSEKQTVELNAPKIDEDTSETQITQKDRHSISNSNLIKDLDTKAKGKKNKINLNKSTPIVVLQNEAKIKRNRTTSWTMVSEANENVFYSDNESTKNKIKSSFVSKHSVSEDIQNISLEKNKSKKKKMSNSFVVENTNQSVNVENNKSKDVSETETDIQNQSKSKAGNENVFDSDNESTKNKIKSSFVSNHSVSEDIQNISLEKNKSKKKKMSNSFVVENTNQSVNIENNKSKDVSETETDIQDQSKSKAGNENVFDSDNESTKNKIKSSFVSNHSVSEDIQNISLEKNKSKKKKMSHSFVVENTNQSVNVENNKSKNVSEMETDIQNQSKSKARNENVNNNTSSLFEKEPSGDIKTLVVIEDSDSNSAKANIHDISDSGDQCVPVVEHPDTLGLNQFTLIPDIVLNKSKNRTITNNSCEPMDVDETMPDSMVIAETEGIEQDSNRISLINDEKEVDIPSNQNSNKSKGKKSLSDNLESVNENKSTLILSHLKDTVASPKIVHKLLSKSAVDLDVTQENESNKKNISLNYLTSTPLQQKSIQKLVMQVNTSIIVSNNDNKHGIDNVENTPKRQDKSDLLNKCDLSDKENNSVSKRVDDKMDVSVANESIKEKSNKVQQKKINLTMEQTNEKTDENEESDEDVPMKISKKLKAKRSKAIKKISSVSSDEESEISDNESRESNILDDEAEDMGDDYESGDSRDESERRFEKENEILEKGETLTSDNDLSNDSDYEKDSFIVSSDEEDNELLEGTEDDLSMSDNELKMTSKSKKKYDERKLKEQKMASREMYESRHKINQKSEKVKKNNRQKLSSSELESSESEKESEKPKKNNRMRLDSSHEASYKEGDSHKNISKTTPRLSKSVCDDAPNEKEITIINESIKEKDPLSQIKEEPKTPLKSANSTIAFIDSGDTIDKNESTKTQAELMDPLEDSMDDDDSLCSENQNIMQNYDSILNDLNKGNKNKTKTCDISLNLDKKSKKKAKTAIVDELNLTQVKSTKKAKNKPVAEVKAHKEEKPSKDSGESSDSIDIHLLFSEDSNDSEDIKNKKEKLNTEDKIIPLKRTEAKSNLREDEDSNLSLNRSAKKSKKRLSQIDKITSHHTITDDTEDNNLSFFIDTEGTHSDTLNKSHNKSLRKNLSINNIDIDDKSDSDETPTQELSIHKRKTQIIDETDSSTNKSLNKSLTKTPGSAKKKHTQKSVQESEIANNSDSDAPMEVSYQKERRESKTQDNLEVEKDETDFVLNKSLNKSVVKTPSSERKKKMNKNYLEDSESLNKSANISLNQTANSGRKTLDIEQIENGDNLTFIEKSFNKSIPKTPASEKKKKKKKSISSVNNEEIGDVESTEIILNNSMDINKKKNSISDNKSLPEELNEEVSNVSLIKTPKSGKKKKISVSHSEGQNEVNTDLSFSKSITKTPSTEIKKNPSIAHIDQSEEDSVETGLDVSKIKTPGSQKKNIPKQKENPDNNDTHSKKRKRKSSVNNAVEKTFAEDGQLHLANESLVINQKKKRKISQQETEEVTRDADRNDKHMIGNNEPVQSIDLQKIRKSKKRKERDDDEGNSVLKVSKQNSCEKAPIPRLPSSLLKQLDDKPQLKNQQPKAKKQKLISTTQFIVEEARKRKAKPSNYLEESVYLNDDEECEKKKAKGRILNPKVLPFVPTASISNSGYTTNFKVNIVPKETKFVAQSNSIGNFKDDYLYNKKIKRQGTYELYKRNRNLKISKF